VNELPSIEDYCTKRSWQLRLRLEDARWLIGLARKELPDRPAPARFDASQLRAWHGRLQKRLRGAVQEKYPKNPAVTWVLLNIIVPIVVKLVTEWWLSRKEEIP
jgi:hypothetical protein